MKNYLLLITFSLLGLVPSNGHFMLSVGRCIFKGEGLKELEYIVRFYFNKQIMMTYNSTLGHWTGHTPRGILVAKDWEEDESERKMEMDLLCINNKAAVQTNLGVFRAKPNVRVKSVKLSSGRHPSMLVCSAYNFYPKQILVTWLRDGQEITTDISSSHLMSDGDFYYQFHSFLEYTPTSGETITCRVEHSSLIEPMFQHWDSAPAEPDRNQIVVGSTGLLLGLVFVFTGLIYYKKKSLAHITLRQEIPVEALLPTGRVDET